MAASWLEFPPPNHEPNMDMCLRGAACADNAPDAAPERAARSTLDEAARRARPEPELAMLDASMLAAAASSALRRRGAAAPAQGAQPIRQSRPDALMEGD